MRNRAPRIASRDIHSGDLTVHMDGDGSYDTLCGLDLYDEDMTGIEAVNGPVRKRINCEQCRQLWLACKGYRASDFADERP